MYSDSVTKSTRRKDGGRAGRSNPTPAPESSSAAPPVANPDHAWKALALVNEWIRHSDAKAGVTLAFSGFLATMLFNLVKDFDKRWWLWDHTVTLACALLVLTVGLCAWTLTPRVRDKDAGKLAINRLFYASISKNFKGEREGYIEVLRTLTADPDDLTRDIAHQVHANAEIATTKAKWAKWAIRSAVGAGATVAFLAVLAGLANP